MKLVALNIVASVSALDSDTATPIQKVIATIESCEGKVIKEGEEFQKTYTAFSEWCEDKAKNLQYETKTAQSQTDELQATVYKETSSQQSLTSQIEDLAADIATDEKDLADATKVRHSEVADFTASEKDLTSVIETLSRAIAVIEREMEQGGASMMQ